MKGGFQMARPRMPARLRRFVYERDRYTCRGCGWSPPVPARYDGRNPIRVVLRTERRVSRVIPSFTDAPERVFYRDHDVVLALEVDHVMPLSAGGAFADPDNLQSLCSTCNNRKGTSLPPARRGRR